MKTLKKPEIKGGAVEGVVVGPEQVDDITKLPSREVLIAQVIGLLLGPARQTLALLSSPSSTVVGQLEALAKRQQGEGSGGSRRSRRRAPALTRPTAADPSACHSSRDVNSMMKLTTSLTLPDGAGQSIRQIMTQQP